MKQTLDLLPLEMLQEAGECLKALGHPVRLRIVDILMQGGFPVHQIAEMCQLPPHQACEHLRLLKNHGFLNAKRRGRAVFYEIADPRLPRLLDCIRAACNNQNEPDPMAGQTLES